MAPSFTSRPRTSDRPPTRDQGDNSLIIPSRTSSLHSRITQPLPSTLNMKPAGQRAPKTLTHAYMVCGVGREPSQWVKAPAPSQGKIGHMKGAVGTFWLPEILGSSPRLETDNEIARSLHAAMRVRSYICANSRQSFLLAFTDDRTRLVSLTTLRFALARASLTASTTLLSSSRIHPIRFTVLHSEFGPGPMRREQRLSGTCGNAPNRITMTTRTRPTGFLTA